MMLLPAIAAALFYSIAAWQLWNCITTEIEPGERLSLRRWIRILALLGTLPHAAVLYPSLVAENSLEISLGVMISLVAWLAVVLYLLGSLGRPVLNLGIIVLPAGILGVLAGALWIGRPVEIPDITPSRQAHLLFALFAYGFLFLAFAQAILLIYQERQLRHMSRHHLIRALPPIETMERILFRLTLLGFTLMTVNLVTGMMLGSQSYGTPLVFNHHILLAVSAWLLFAILLLGHYALGWRGENAARWTIAGFVILALAYFGTRFVVDVILQRPPGS